MPTVGGKQFPYTNQGRRDAEAYRQTLGGNNRWRDQVAALDELDVIYDGPGGSEVEVEMAAITPNVYRQTIESVRDRRDPQGRRRRREEELRRHAQRREYGPYGYAGETKREHYDRLWDRDWDEDTEGRRWHPRSPEAGRR
jgi:hypothetical protein